MFGREMLQSDERRWTVLYNDASRQLCSRYFWVQGQEEDEVGENYCMVYAIEICHYIALLLERNDCFFPLSNS